MRNESHNLRPTGKRNIVVLLLDSVRAKDVYGDAKLSTLRNIMKNGTTYQNVVSPGTWTGSVHASLFSNKPIREIPGVKQDFFENGNDKIDPWLAKTKFLPAEEETLARKLSRQGYSTALFSNNPFLTQMTNLSLGFDTVKDLWRNSITKHDKKLVNSFSGIIEGGSRARMAMYLISNAFTLALPKPIFDKLYLYLRIKLDQKIASVDGTHMQDRGALDTNAALESHLKGYGGIPTFMFVNYMEAHENYPTSDKRIIPDKWLYLSGIKKMHGGVTKDLHDSYVRRIRYLDSQLSKSIAIMKKSGFLDNATLIIASDHGQFFGEHGLLYHSMFPYDEVTKVPLISVNYENGKMVKNREVVEDPVSLLSLHNAILDLASGKEDHLDGNIKSTKYVVSEHTGIIEGWDEALLRLLKPRSNYASLIYNTKKKFNEPVTAVYYKGYKLLHFLNEKKTELYRIYEDPEESCNIMGENRSVASHMLRNSSAI